MCNELIKDSISYLPAANDDTIESWTICSVSTSLATSPCMFAPLLRNLVPAYLLLLLAMRVRYMGRPNMFKLLCSTKPCTMYRIQSGWRCECTADSKWLFHTNRHSGTERTPKSNLWRLLLQYKKYKYHYFLINLNLFKDYVFVLSYMILKLVMSRCFKTIIGAIHVLCLTKSYPDFCRCSNWLFQVSNISSSFSSYLWHSHLSSGSWLLLDLDW